VRSLRATARDPSESNLPHTTWTTPIDQTDLVGELAECLRTDVDHQSNWTKPGGPVKGEYCARVFVLCRASDAGTDSHPPYGVFGCITWFTTRNRWFRLSMVNGVLVNWMLATGEESS
jgi:hypothetical protein